MAINETTQEEPVEHLTAQIADRFSGIYNQLDPKELPVELSESFDIWHLDTEGIQSAMATGTFPAYKTNQQHHQLLIGKHAGAYAVSESSAGSRRVINVALSQLAEQIDQAIGTLDAKFSDDTVARLLVIPSLRVYAFWLADRERIHIVSVPVNSKALSVGQVLPTMNFLKALYDEIKLQSHQQKTGKQWKERY